MKVIIIMSIAILSIGFITAINTRRANPADSKPQSKSTSSLSSNTTVYDVRTPEEYATGHVDGSLSLPLIDIQAGKLPNVDKNASIAIYCRSGNRSAQAANLLAKAGYKNIKNLGGLSDVQHYGLKLSS